MTPALDSALRSAYPHVFSAPLLNDEPIRCGDGWYPLLERLCARLEALIVAIVPPERHAFHATQVKEKLGGLRFYMSHSTDEMRAAIDAAETESLRTCDVCGKPGEKRGGAPLPNPWWVRTRCNDHINWREGGTGFAHASEEET